jgi:hypothetical protein
VEEGMDALPARVAEVQFGLALEDYFKNLNLN